MNQLALMFLSSTPTPAPAGPGAAVYGSPGFWLAAAAAFGGLLLIIGDTIIRWKSLENQAELAGAANVWRMQRSHLNRPWSLVVLNPQI